MRLIKLITITFFSLLILGSCHKNDNTLSGKVTYSNITGTYVASNATIALTFNLNSSPAYTCISDANGNYKITDIGFGTYTVTGTVTNSLGLTYTIAQTIDIPKNSNKTLDLNLQ